MLLFWYQGFKIHSLTESGGACYWQTGAAGCLNPGDWHPPEQQTETLYTLRANLKLTQLPHVAAILDTMTIASESLNKIEKGYLLAKNL